MTASWSLEIYNMDDQCISMEHSTSARWDCASASITLSKDEYIYFKTNNTSSEGAVTLTATPLVNDVVLLNSQDEIFTDWTDAGAMTITGVSSNPGKGTVEADKVRWRRVGSDMEVTYNLVTAASSSGSAGSGTYLFTLPGGYSADAGKVTIDGTITSGSDNTQVGYGYVYARQGSYEQGEINIFVDSSGTKLYARCGSIVKDDGTSSSWSGDTLSNSTFDLNYGQRWSFRATIPIAGWTSTFNPVLSMPLVDFGSFENTYSARVTNDGSTSTITSQSGNFIASVSRTGSNGGITVNFTSGMFSVAPSVIVTCDGASGNRFASVSAISTTACTINADEDAGSNPNQNMNLTVTRQGSDYRQPPQPTAAVIKPAVAIGRIRHANGTNGGNSGNAAYVQRKFNTWEGETWFVSGFDGTMGPDGTTDQFDLDPGTYKVNGHTTAYKSNGSFSKMESTDSSVVLWGTNGRPGSAEDVNVLLPFEGLFTITEKKTFKIYTWTATPNTTYGLGVEIGTSTSAPSSRLEEYGVIMIEKLK